MLTTPEAPDLHGLFAMMRERGVDGVRDGGLQPRAGHGPGRRRGLRRRGLHQPRARPPRLPRRPRRLLRRQGLPVHPRAGAARPGQRRRPVRPPPARRAEVPLRTFSAAGADADWRATDVVLEATGSRFTVHGPDGLVLEAGVPLPGDFNVANALAAVAGAAEAGYDPAALVAGMAARPRRPRPAGAGRGRPGLRRGRRLRPQARRGGVRAAHAAPARRGPADRRDRRRRRPRPRQAPADGRDRRPAGRRAGRHRRQPPDRGPGGHPRRGARRHPGRPAPRCSRSATAGAPSARRWPGPGPATSCWSPARATRPARRSATSSTRSTTARSRARSSAALDEEDLR